MLSDAMIDAAVMRYRRGMHRHRALTSLVMDACRQVLEDDLVPATVNGRAKSPESLRAKLRRDRDRYASVEEALASVGDLAAVRVATYLEGDRGRAVKAVVGRFAGRGGAPVVPEHNDKPPPSFYRATHCQVWLTRDELGPLHHDLVGISCEIQVCGLLANVWNELEHDLGYKRLTGELSGEERAALEQLGHLVRAGDGLVDALGRALMRRLAGAEGPFTSQWDLVARLSGWFPSSPSFASHARELFDEMTAAGLRSPAAVGRELFPGLEPGEFEGAAVGLLGRFRHRFADRVVALDDETSDPLMIAFLHEHRASVLERHEGRRNGGRAPRIAEAARRMGGPPDLSVLADLAASRPRAEPVSPARPSQGRR